MMRTITSGAIISPHHPTLPLFPLSLKNEARNCCDVLRNCFLKTMLQDCCAISLYRRIRAGNSITAAVDLSKTHTLKIKGCAGRRRKTFQYVGLSRRR